MEVKDRKDIDVKDTWNLESIYANNELWEEDYAALENDAAEFAKLKGAIEADVSKIPAVLDAYYGLHRRLSKLSVYAKHFLSNSNVAVHHRKCLVNST